MRSAIFRRLTVNCQLTMSALTVLTTTLLCASKAQAVEKFPVALKLIHTELNPDCSTCHAPGAGKSPGEGNVTPQGHTYYQELMAHEAQRNRSLPSYSDALGTVDFVVFGDTRTNDDIHQQIVTAICKENPQIAIHTGDMVVDGSDTDLWNTALKIEDCLIKDHKLYATCGNHEGDYCTDNPLRQALGNTDRYYKIERFGFTFLVLDSNNIDQAEINWLKAMPVGPHYVPVYHHAPYPTIAGHAADANTVDHFVPEFQRLGVKIAFNGHNHGYDRASVDGVTYVTGGGGGAPLYPCGPDLPYTKFCVSDYNYLRCQVTQATLSCNIIRLDGRIIDQFSAAF